MPGPVLTFVLPRAAGSDEDVLAPKGRPQDGTVPRLFPQALHSLTAQARAGTVTGCSLDAASIQWSRKSAGLIGRSELVCSEHKLAGDGCRGEEHREKVTSRHTLLDADNDVHDIGQCWCARGSATGTGLCSCANTHDDQRPPSMRYKFIPSIPRKITTLSCPRPPFLVLRRH